MAPIKIAAMRHMLMSLRKVCQHPFLSAPELEHLEAPEAEQHKALVGASGKLAFLKVLLPKLKERRHRVLLFSQFKIALDLIEDFLYGEGYKYLRLDGDVQQAKRQKSVDAFNAPGSDYFIFLLTTRAGGVGINLATADTVIVHDPDFNPHQDQQAIARAHRYGQKKPVMVFKLMTKNSVEERIIEKTKKKLVLDHLIVQNLDRDNDEGQIDDMILHGAKALYDADAEGRAASDIHYTSKMVDDLIDKVAREAQEEVEAQAERDRAKAAGEEVPGGEKAKELLAFDFAKIWEVEGGQLAELPTAEEPTEEEAARDQAEALAKMLESAREGEQKRLAEELAARTARRRQGQVQYQNDGLPSDDSPVKKKKGKGKKALKNTEMVNADSDGDFAPVADAANDDKTDGEMSDDAEVLQDENGKVIKVPGRHRFTDAELAQWNATREAGKATSRGRIVLPLSMPPLADGTLAPPNSEAVAGPSMPRPTARKPKETDPEKAAQKAAVKEARRKMREAAIAESRVANAIASAPGAGSIDPRIRDAQNIMQWLYQTFAEVGFDNAKKEWAALGVVGYRLEERKRLYRHLAKLADQILERVSYPEFFSTPDSVASVCWLLDHGAPIIPARMDELPMIPFPQAPPPVQPRQGQAAETAPENQTPVPAPPSNTPVIQSETAGQAPVAMGPPTLKTSPAQPRAALPVAQASVPSSGSANHNPQNKDAAKELHCPFCRSQGGDDRHAFSECHKKISLEVLLKYQEQLKTSHEPPEVIAQATRKINDIIRLYRKYGDAENSTKAAAAAATLPGSSSRAVAEASSSPTTRTRAHASAAGSSSKKRAAGTSTGTGTAGDAIVVEDDDEAAPPAQAPPSKKTRIDLSSGVSTFTSLKHPGSSSQIGVAPMPLSTEVQPQQKIAVAGAASQTAGAKRMHPPASLLVVQHLNGASTPIKSPAKSPARGRPKTFLGCTICGVAKFHPAVECPVVKAGPESIARAMRQFSKSDALYSVLQDLYTRSKRCPYCDQACHRTVRECATALAPSEKKGRKALKDLIRRVDAEREKVIDQDGRAKWDERMGMLYDAYQSWPK